MPLNQAETPTSKAATPRVRLLPVLAGVMTLVLTIRVGDVYQHISVGVGSETQAQSAPAGNAAPAQPAGTSAAAPAANAAPTVPAGGEAPAATSDGIAPAEGEAAASAATPPKDPLEYTDEEVEVLQQLAKRREELELKSRQLDEREAMVVAAEQRMEQKMAELKALQSTVEDLLKKRSDEEESRLQMLVATYEKMKPKEAAQVFEEMDMDLLVDLVSRMKTSRAAPILALVSPTKVKELTFELAQQKAMPFAP
ncbi:MotE family protein [Dongia sp.]|jgi:flagellar motility protein MotE (MotC chaperone)|uniref:MotE family protein n=1 Tax=Dongia sp. TaxID=1977262 RepID=UPI0035AFE4EE